MPTPELLTDVSCRACLGTGEVNEKPCRWCGGKGSHLNVPYPMFCLHPQKCAGKGSCPRGYSCCD